MPSAADGQGDGDNIGFDLRARAVGDKAIELDAVPRCVGRDQKNARKERTATVKAGKSKTKSSASASSGSARMSVRRQRH